MAEIVKRTTLAALLLLLLPVGMWISGWQWQPGEMGLGDQILFAFTETVTRPWGTLTSTVLCAWFLWCLRYRLKPALLLLAIMLAAILLGQYTKGVIKEQVREPRPYVLWLEQQRGIDPLSFYQQHRKARSEQVTAAVRDDMQLPAWLKRHWAFETGFAFPSGHTMFAASWALLGVGLLWPRRRYLTLAVLLVWAELVMVSRLMLGMHWPRDLVVATLFSWLFVTFATWLAQRFCGPLSVPPQEQQAIAQQENTPS